jgi:hypothetical protein
MHRFTPTLLALGLVAVAACGREKAPTAPAGPMTVSAGVADAARETAAVVQSVAHGKLDICHRTEGAAGYVPLSVPEQALPAHLGHGDARVGDPVPGDSGMRFDAACRPVSPRIVTLTGSYFNHLRTADFLTLSEPERVEATATLTMTYPSTDPVRLELRPFVPVEPFPCGDPVRVGPAMLPPVVTAGWSSVPAGTYCVIVAPLGSVPPYTWTATVTLTP